MSKASAKRQWDTDVNKMLSMFEGSYANPFNIEDPPSHLINFASGVVATDAVEASLTKALDKGEVLLQTFVADCLMPSAENELPKVSFYDRLPQSGVETMTSMNKTVKLKGRDVAVDGEVMYL